MPMPSGIPIIVTWSEIDATVHRLSQQIQQDGKPDMIVAIQRGGLIPGVMLSHALGTRPLLTISVTRTTDDGVDAEKRAPVALDNPGLATISQKDVLLVDDIAGSGLTLDAALTILGTYSPNRVRILVCVVNHSSRNAGQPSIPGDVLAYVGEEVGRWVIFPWENQIDPPEFPTENS